MSKTLFVMDSRVSNTPECSFDKMKEEIERRLCTICEDYCIVSTEPISLARAEMLRRVLSADEKTINIASALYKKEVKKARK